MTSDIVERLRAPDCNGRVGILDAEAADEITRLRAELAAERERRAGTLAEYDKLIDEWNAEREKTRKLREALERFKASADRADSINLADKDAIYVVVAHLRHACTVLKETKE